MERLRYQVAIRQFLHHLCPWLEIMSSESHCMEVQFYPDDMKIKILILSASLKRSVNTVREKSVHRNLTKLKDVRARAVALVAECIPQTRWRRQLKLWE